MIDRHVQRIVYLLRENGDGLAPARAIESVYAGRKYDSWRDADAGVRDARLIVLLDGVDEAAGLRDEIETFVHKELVPSGVRSGHVAT